MQGAVHEALWAPGRCPQCPRCTVTTPRNTGDTDSLEGQTISCAAHTYCLASPWVCYETKSVSAFPIASDRMHDSDGKTPWAIQTHPSRKKHHTLRLRVSDQWRAKFPFLFSVNSQFSPDPFPKEKEYLVSSGTALLWAVNSCKDLEYFIGTCWLSSTPLSGGQWCCNDILKSYALHIIHPARKNIKVTNRRSKITG